MCVCVFVCVCVLSCIITLSSLKENVRRVK